MDANFRTDENGIEVGWRNGISADDVIAAKNSLSTLFYEIYRYIDRIVDYMDDIA